MSKTLTHISPKEATTLNKMCQLNCDNIDIGDMWFLINQRHVSIGTPNNSTINIPRKYFNRIVKWYLHPQKLKPKK